MQIAILGRGIEGKSAYNFFRKQFRNQIPKLKLEVRDIKERGKGYLKNLEKFDIVVRSPGIPYLSPEIQKAKKAGVKITSTTKLFFKNAKGILIGITGTKGKGTTATLLYKILKANYSGSRDPNRKNIHLIGNIGIPMLDELPKLNKNSISVLELSSFQLQDLDTSPHIAAILDISPDHLNYHKTFKEYIDAKASIGKFQKKTDKIFYFTYNQYSKQIAKKSCGKKIPVFMDKKLILKIPGAHNQKNASMAKAIASALGVREDIINKTIRQFSGLPHRLEFVGEIKGISFYNDSASTNPAATVAALNAFRATKILIAGGAGKNLDYGPISTALKNSNTKLVILYGQNKKEIANQISGAVGNFMNIIFVDKLVSAVKVALMKAERGDVVILSPASTAFDQFSGYGERGKNFKQIVKRS